MLYQFGGKTYLMRGTENIPEVKKFSEHFTDSIEAEQYLSYLFYTYHKQKSPYITLPVQRRRDFIITHFKLFDFESKLAEDKNLSDEIESNKYFGLLRDFFIELTYTSLERQAMAYDVKIEMYQEKLKDPFNTPSVDIEYSKALTILRNAKIEIDVLISNENQDEEMDGRLHLFEIPDEHFQGVNGIFI